jgi:hypothetical protein
MRSLSSWLTLFLAFSTGCSAVNSDTSSIGGGASGSDSNASAGASAGGGSSARDGSAPDDDICAADTFFAELEPAALIFQLDTSGSMNCPITNPGCLNESPTAAPNDSRWDVFRTTLNAVLAGLPDSLAAGLMHYPEPDRACASMAPVVPIGALSSTRSAIASQLMSLVPEYITPTHDAVLAALAQVRARKEGGRFVVLATDGAASVCRMCNAACTDDQGRVPSSDNDAMIAAVRTAFESEGIRTFVVGVPGSQGYRDVLSRLAEAGGTSRGDGCSESGPAYCHYDLTDATTDFGALLGETLAEIGGSVLTCELDVPENAEVDLDRVNVRLTNGASVNDLKRDKSEQNGWNYSQDERSILLFGPACEAAKAVTNGRIDILYGCPTIEVI